MKKSFIGGEILKMNFKMIVICIYIMLIYWLSLQFPYLDTLFFPTVGAFSFLFVSRALRFSEISKITLGAFISSAMGTLFFFIYPSPIMLFVNVLITMWLVTTCKWNAPPIVAVSLIPFFSHSSNHWFIPLSVCGVLLGLMVVIFIAERVERKWADYFAFPLRNKVMRDSDKLAG
ncbi:HPP family protein [Brevibacillus choshinensis]|uniref:HPP family protein n=1 Tax=Brevibacillus choshinensis TaxID=54911 RepID=UPI002E24C524|nr:HPP family protein [Brevibacillus choshinensis]